MNTETLTWRVYTTTAPRGEVKCKIAWSESGTELSGEYDEYGKALDVATLFATLRRTTHTVAAAFVISKYGKMLFSVQL